MNRFTLVFMMFVGSSLAGCRAGLPSPFALEWRGGDLRTTPLPAVANGFAANNLLVAPFVDRRIDPSVVGHDEDSRIAYQSTSNVAQFCTMTFASALYESGARLVESGQSVTIQGDIVKYHVTEGGNFNAEVVLRISVVDRAGGVMWSGDVSGRSSRWGRSHSVDNINEALSNALAEAIKHLLQTEAFGAALSAGSTTH